MSRSMPWGLVLVLCACGLHAVSTDSDGGGNPPDAGAVITDAGAPPGTTIYTINVGPLPVSKGSQAVYCTNIHLGNPTAIDVIGFNSVQTLGGHHVILMVNKTDQPDSAPTTCGQSTAVDPKNGSMIYISQVAQDAQRYPPQVGMSLQANASLMVQVHYLDATNMDLQVSTTIQVLAAATGTVSIPAAPLLYYAAQFSVPPGQSTVTTSCTMTNAQPYQFFMLAGHMHSHGTDLQINYTPVGGSSSKIYETATWDSPQEENFSPALAVPSGSQFSWTCDYNNTTTTTVNDPNEMCAILGNYYPATQGSLTCFALANTGLCQCGFGGLPDGGL
jgi:hypothetical protein